MAKNSTIDIERLMRLEPLSTLSNERLDELAKLAYVERVSIGVSLFREGDLDNQTLYLLHGDVQLSSSDGNFDEVISSRHNSAKFPLDDSQPRQVSCVALGLVEFLRIDNSVLDYMMMWDQLAVQEELLGSPETDKAAEEKQAEEKQTDKQEEKQVEAAVTDEQAEDKDQDSDKVDDKIEETKDAEAASDTESANENSDDEASILEGSNNDESTNLDSSDEQDVIAEVEDEARTEKISLSETSGSETEQEKSTQSDDIDKDDSAAEPEIVHSMNGAVENGDGIPEKTEKGAWMRRMRHIMAFKNLPPANIKDLLERMEQIKVKKGETIVHQGEQGDSFYVLTDGLAKVTRTIELAELKAGSSFGEESLVSGGERNASITMKTDGVLMKLAKQDFDELLKEPMLNRISPEDARIRSFKGDHWLDVRHASEYHHSHLRKASNVPLHEIRMRMEELDKSLHYICYCNTGRRSSAAAFILAQSGFNVSILNGGVRVMPQDLVKG